MGTPFSPGSRLGNYEILGPLGKGGMGEVYRAKDTKLDRLAAIKVLPPALARDPDRLARFEREAKVLASLNHPNIATIYGLEESPEGKAIAMELVDGAPLSSPQSLQDALRYAVQIAEALEAAHEKSITHRDLKPGNILVTASGQVKVLDFGLAAVGHEARPTGEDSPTLSLTMTQSGMIMGTAAYMAPEQAIGNPVDRRADIWSFGVVLWEMLTGKRLFSGETTAHVLADVIRADIDFTKLPPDLPAPIRTLLKRCLERDIKARLQWIGEARIAIQDYLAHPNPVVPVAVASNPLQGGIVRMLAATLIMVSGAMGYFIYKSSNGQTPAAVQSSLVPPPNTDFSSDNPSVLSPDGRQVAFVATTDGKRMLWLQDLSTGSVRTLNGTEGARQPFWAPTGKSLAFIQEERLMRIELAGGSPITLCPITTTSYAGTWSEQGIILFTPSGTSGLFRVPANGGTPEQITTLDAANGEISHRYPVFLPDGRHFLFSKRNLDPGKSAVAVGDLNSKDTSVLFQAETNVAYSPAGYLLYAAERNDSPLMARAFDAASLRFTGDPIQLSASVSVNQGSWGQHHLTISSSGMLLFSPGSGIRGRKLSWLNHEGKIIGALPSVGEWSLPRLSPDERFVAAQNSGLNENNVWLLDTTRGTSSRLTFSKRPNREDSPVWSPDGRDIIFTARDDKAADLSRIPAQGGKAQRLTATDDGRLIDRASWSRDGRFLAVTLSAYSRTGTDIGLVDLNAPHPKIELLLAGDGIQRNPSFAPSGAWIAYTAADSGRPEVWVQSFPTLGRKYQLSLEGGDNPVWSKDGREVYFVSSSGRMMAVSVKEQAGALELGAPNELFNLTTLGVTATTTFDVSKDGRFLIPVPLDPGSPPLTLVQNWPAALKK